MLLRGGAGQGLEVGGETRAEGAPLLPLGRGEARREMGEKIKTEIYGGWGGVREFFFSHIIVKTLLTSWNRALGKGEP